MIATHRPQRTKYYYHFDGLGSVVALSNNDGDIVERYSYDVFGRPTIRDQWLVARDTSAYGNSRMFTGREWDVESSLYYYRARNYSPWIGRFLQTDPMGYDAGLNLYTYCENNPISLVDPHGLACGTKGWDLVIPDKFGDADFTKACENHDDCYDAKGPGGCNTSKITCDSQFQDDMYKECKRAYENNLKMRQECRRRADWYRRGVESPKGQEAFKSARKKANCPDCKK